MWLPCPALTCRVLFLHLDRARPTVCVLPVPAFPGEGKIFNGEFRHFYVDRDGGFFSVKGATHTVWQQVLPLRLLRLVRLARAPALLAWTAPD